MISPTSQASLSCVSREHPRHHQSRYPTEGGQNHLVAAAISCPANQIARHEGMGPQDREVHRLGLRGFDGMKVFRTESQYGDIPSPAVKMSGKSFWPPCADTSRGGEIGSDNENFWHRLSFRDPWWETTDSNMENRLRVFYPVSYPE